VNIKTAKLNHDARSIRFLVRNNFQFVKASTRKNSISLGANQSLTAEIPCHAMA